MPPPSFRCPMRMTRTPRCATWVAAYKKRFTDDPGLFSMYGYYAVTTFAKLADKAGKKLNAVTFNAAAEATRGSPG